MANFTGMDIQQVRNLAQQLNAGADRITELTQQLTAALGNTPWVGQDQQRFSSDWNGQHRSALANVANSLRDASRTATKNAQEQEQASNA